MKYTDAIPDHLLVLRKKDILRFLEREPTRVCISAQRNNMTSYGAHGPAYTADTLADRIGFSACGNLPFLGLVRPIKRKPKSGKALSSKATGTLRRAEDKAAASERQYPAHFGAAVEIV
jgi:hypothetical protein